MARKRGEYQKRKALLNKLETFFAVLVVLLVCIFLACTSVNHAVTLRHIRQNTLEEYTGFYSYELKRTYGKNHQYYYDITLDNGDVLSVRKALCDNQRVLQEKPILTFRYSKHVRKDFFSSSYAALSIETADGSVTLVDLETSEQICVNSVWVYSISLSVLLLLFGGLLAVYYFMVVRDKRIVNQRK